MLPTSRPECTVSTTGRGPRRVVRIEAHGGPEVLGQRVLDEVALSPEQVRVGVRYVGLNHLDLWVRRGVPGHDFHLPRIPGSDVAGEVVEVASDVADRVPIGQPVALHPSWGCNACPACLSGRHNRCPSFSIRGETVDGGCATTVVVPAWHLLPVPSGLSLIEAAALPLTLLTAWHMLVERAALGRGERVLVQAGGSGVGLMAIRVAQLLGCEVHATASTAARRERLEALGVRAWAYEAVGARGSEARDFDVVVENTGAATWAGSLRALAWGGRLVTCGATTGAEAAINLRALFFKQQSYLGSTMGSSGDMVRAWAEVVAGTLRPVVDRVMPMSKLGDAHGVLERREAFGKVVVEQDLES